MLYDSTRCIGCRACVTACKTANNLPGNIYDPPNDLNGETKNIIKLYNGEEGHAFVKQQCMHCVDPACAAACPNGALKFGRRDELLAVLGEGVRRQLQQPGADDRAVLPGCGHGFESALVLPPLVWIGGRMRRRRR